MMVAARKLGWRLMYSASANPSISGICASSRISGKVLPIPLDSVNVTMALAPLSATVGTMRQPSSIFTSICRFVALSSTTSTRMSRRVVGSRGTIVLAAAFCTLKFAVK